MNTWFFLRGLFLGLSIAAPVGPIGVLCIRRTLAEGRLYGFVSGLGAATADAIYGSIAGFGLTLISSVLVQQQGWLKLVGGLFLCYLGVRTFLAQPAEKAAETKGKGLLGAYLSILLLTLTNPVTILFFAGVFTGMGVGGAERAYSSAALLVLGVFCGSAIWWLTLSSGTSLLRNKLNQGVLRWINRFSGVVIVAFGVAALVSWAQAILRGP